MRSFSSHALCTLALAVCVGSMTVIGSWANVPQLVAAEPKSEWVDLLPDHQLDKFWKTAGNWSVNDDGVIVLEPRPGEKGWKRYDAYLWLTDEYTNFDVDFEYKLQPGGNSGFYFHVGDITNPVVDGTEVQIYDSYGKDRLTDHTSGGVIPGIAPQKNAAKPAGEWNRFQISVQGDQLTIKLNGQLVNEVKLGTGRLAGRPKTGVIGFQDHGLPLALKNIKIRKR